MLQLYQDRIVASLQQPYSLECIPVEAEDQVSLPIFWTDDAYKNTLFIYRFA